MADVRNPRLKLGQTLIDFCFSRIVDIINLSVCDPFMLAREERIGGLDYVREEEND